eukprot:4323627-Lingulodinium_polyedra.AAC.1
MADGEIEELDQWLATKLQEAPGGPGDAAGAAAPGDGGSAEPAPGDGKLTRQEALALCRHAAAWGK